MSVYDDEVYMEYEYENPALLSTDESASPTTPPQSSISQEHSFESGLIQNQQAPFHDSTTTFVPTSSKEFIEEPSTLESSLPIVPYQRDEYPSQPKTSTPPPLCPDVDPQASAMSSIPTLSPSAHAPAGPAIYPIIHQHYDPVAHQRGSIVLFSGLLQLGCNMALITMSLYVSVQFAIALSHDVKLKMEAYESDRLEEHFYCQQLYIQNRCDPTTRLPAMADLCREWQRCLYRPAWIGKTKVLAETFAEIANGFVDTISFKTMFFTLAIIMLSLWASNLRSPKQKEEERRPIDRSYAYPSVGQAATHHPSLYTGQGLELT